MNRCSNYFKDIMNIIRVRVKLLLCNKKLIALYVFFGLVVITMLITFFKSAKDKSSIPIGMVDLDNSMESRTLLDKLDDVEAIRVVKGEEDKLREMLLKNEINSIFVIERGFSDKLHNLDFEKIIIDYYPSNLTYARVLSDIVLSGILDEVSYLYLSNEYYRHSKDYSTVVEKDEYEKYIADIYKNQKSVFAFDFQIVDLKKNSNGENNHVKQSNVTDKMTNDLLYKEILVGITAVILMIVSLLMGIVIINDYREGTIKRWYISRVSPSARLLGDIFASCLVNNVFALLVTIFLCKQIGFVSVIQIIKFLLIIFLFTSTISSVFVILTKITKKYVSYQIMSTIITLIVGVMGALYILGFLVGDFGEALMRISPMGILINEYKNIVLNNSDIWNYLMPIAYIILLYTMTYVIQESKGEYVGCES